MCEGSGVTFRKVDGELFSKPCKCVQNALNKKHLSEAGLSAMADYSLDSYSTNASWRKIVKSKAESYLTEWKNYSFGLFGQSGAGKTHIAGALLNEISKSGATLAYMKWVDDSRHLKSIINDAESYENSINRFLSADVLYINDLFKNDVSDADIRLAFEIIDGRCSIRKPMIISSERTLEYIRDAKDRQGEAIAGRLLQATGGGKYRIDLTGQDKNFRMYGDR